MNNASVQPNIAYRQFIAMIRSALDAAGHTDVAVERRWIDTDTEGHTFLLNVPVGPDLSVPLMPTNDWETVCEIADLERHVAQFAAALVNLKAAASSLVRYAENVRRAARKAIAAARADGVDLLLDGVGFKPVRAWGLSSGSWKDGVDYVLASVRIRSTSFYFQNETQEIWIEEPEHVAEELKELVEEQRERQLRLAAMEARGADLEIDAIALDLLEAHGFEPAKVLRDVWKQQCVNLPITNLGEDRYLSLVSYEGKVVATAHVGEAYWNGEHLWFLDGHEQNGYDQLVGEPLGDRISHPVFASRPIVAVDAREERGVDLIHFDLSDKLLFDGDTGRIWREERLAA